MLRFFHCEKSKNLHKLIPVTSPGNLLLQTSINKNIKDSKLLNKINSLIIFHFLGWIIKRMSVVQHLMKNNSNRVYVTLMGINGFTLTLMKVYLWSHSVRSSAFFTKNCQFRSDRLSKSKVWNLYCVVLEKNILEFKISVNDIFLVQIIYALNYLFKVSNFLLNSCLIQCIPQISFTKFQGNVAVLIKTPKVI